MRTSIATVSISGRSPRNCTPAPRPASTASRSSNPTSSPATTAPRRSAASLDAWACRSICISRCATSRASTRPPSPRTCAAPARRSPPRSASASTRSWSAATSRPQRRLRRGVGRPAAPTGRPRAARTASGWPSRRWRGAASSTTTAGRGASSNSPTTRRSGCASTASTCCPVATTPPRSSTSPATRSSTSSLPTPPRSAWTCCRGAATTGCSPAKAPSTWPPSSRTCCRRASTARCRSRSSTTPSGRPIRPAPRCMRSVRWCGCRTRSPRSDGRRQGQAAGGGGGEAAQRFRLRRTQGRGHQRGRGAARPTRLHAGWTPPHEAGVAVGRGRAPASSSTNNRPRSAPARRGGRLQVPDAEATSRRAADLMAAARLPSHVRRRTGTRRRRRARRHRDLLGHRAGERTAAGVDRRVRERTARDVNRRCTSSTTSTCFSRGRPPTKRCCS